jgi:hypothetical protein
MPRASINFTFNDYGKYRGFSILKNLFFSVYITALVVYTAGNVNKDFDVTKNSLYYEYYDMPVNVRLYKEACRDCKDIRALLSQDIVNKGFLEDRLVRKMRDSVLFRDDYIKYLEKGIGLLNNKKD